MFNRREPSFIDMISLVQAYCLLDAAFTAKSSNPGDFKGIKQFKQIRQDSKGSMKAISSRLKALNEDLSRKYKARNKLEALLPLKQFEQVGSVALWASSELMLMSMAGFRRLPVRCCNATAGQSQVRLIPISKRDNETDSRPVRLVKEQ